MSYSIGIDLGTTNSVACVWRRGRPETLTVDGRTTLPSAISVRPNGNVLIGKAANARSLLEPTESVTSAKRHIGDGKISWLIGNKTYTPIEVDALILGRLKEAASDFLGENVTEAVITVPAYFNNNQKRDTKLAAEAAGFQVLQLLPEPTAAAISYGLDQGKDQTVLVYDLGGGTFDVSVLKVQGNRFSVVAVDGDFNLGGDDFDLLLAEHLVGLLQKQATTDLKPVLELLRQPERINAPRRFLIARARLREAAEAAKIELALSDTTQVTIPDILGTLLDEEITIKTYNRLIEPLVAKTITKIQDVLAAANLTEDDIDRVILVGGSTRNRLVKERVTEAVKEPFIAERVDEVVGQGAAIVASYLSTPEEDLTPIEFNNVTPFSLGVRASKGKDLDIFQVLIAKNTSIPSEVTQEFTTFRANQKSVDISVFQGENSHCQENTFIGGFQLEGIPPAPVGQPKILVRFEMDNSDLLTVTANCKNLSSQKTLDVNLIGLDKIAKAAPQADIMFLVDTSGSMSDELEGVKRSCLNFANQVMETGVECRLGLMDFDKTMFGNHYNWEVFGPMEPTQFPPAIAGLKIGRLGGCGCHIGEINTIPVIEAFVESFPSNEFLKIGILISDEIGRNDQAIEKIVKILQDGMVCLYVVGISGSCHEKLAKETGGRFWNIQKSRGKVDFSQLLDAIAVEITNLALR